MTICEDCHLPGTHDTEYREGYGPGQDCCVAQANAMKTLLGLIGDKAVCAGCNAEIYWVKHRNGNRAPYTPAGLNHFLNCPEAARFKRT